MPSHTHANGVYKFLLLRDGRVTVAKIDDTAHEPNLGSAGEILEQGGNMPHENMQPSLALNYIIKH